MQENYYVAVNIISITKIRHVGSAPKMKEFAEFRLEPLEGFPFRWRKSAWRRLEVLGQMLEHMRIVGLLLRSSLDGAPTVRQRLRGRFNGGLLEFFL